MENLGNTAAAGMFARMQALEIVANNLANASTTGFKAQVEFHEVMEGMQGRSIPQSHDQWTDMSQGTLIPTGKPTDLAISGTGFFVVDTKSGPLLTRNGTFRQLPGGELVTVEGHKLRNATGGPLTLRPGAPFTVRGDGSVMQDGVEAGRVEISEVADVTKLEKVGNQLFEPKRAGALRPATGQVVQGSLEGSNVSVVDTSVRMISVMRQFESLQKALSINSDMNRKTVEEVARVTGG